MMFYRQTNEEIGKLGVLHSNSTLIHGVSFLVSATLKEPVLAMPRFHKQNLGQPWEINFVTALCNY